MNTSAQEKQIEFTHSGLIALKERFDRAVKAGHAEFRKIRNEITMFLIGKTGKPAYEDLVYWQEHLHKLKSQKGQAHAN